MPKQLSAVEYAWNQANRLRAERDDARGEIKRLQRDLENMKYHNELKAGQIDRQADEIRDLRTRLNQLRAAARVQSDQLQAPRGDTRRRDSNAGSWAQQENSSVAFQTGPPTTPMHRGRPFPLPSTPHVAMAQQYHQTPERVTARTNYHQGLQQGSFHESRYPSAIEVIESERQNSAARYSAHPGHSNQQRDTSAHSYQKRNHMPSHSYQQGNTLSYSYQQGNPSAHSHQRSNNMELEEPVVLGEQPTYQSSRAGVLPYRLASISSNFPVDSMQPTVAPPNSMGPRPGPLIVREDSLTTDWQTQLSNFFRRVEEWTRRYANVPNQADVGEALTQVLSKYSDSDLVWTLLNNTDNRYFLVARLVNSWITSDLFKPSAFRDFSEAGDDKVNDLLHQVQHDTAIEMHHALQEAIAAAGKELTQMAGFDRYIGREVDMRASALWDRVFPLLAPQIADTEAWDELTRIYREGFRLSALMSCTPLVFTLQYPLVGDNEYFNPATMLNRDPSFLGDPTSLQRQRLRVRLGITPVVFTTSYSGKTVDTGAVHKANVLLMY